MLIERVLPDQISVSGCAQRFFLPHVVFYSQRVRIAETDRLHDTCRYVEEMELEEENSPPLLPSTSGERETSSDSEGLVRLLSDGGLHDMLLGFFAQQ